MIVRRVKWKWNCLLFDGDYKTSRSFVCENFLYRRLVCLLNNTNKEEKKINLLPNWQCKRQRIFFFIGKWSHCLLVCHEKWLHFGIMLFPLDLNCDWNFILFCFAFVRIAVEWFSGNALSNYFCFFISSLQQKRTDQCMNRTVHVSIV